jgi:hypothetical protein
VALEAEGHQGCLRDTSKQPMQLRRLRSQLRQQPKACRATVVRQTVLAHRRKTG